jgi:hypothetical protein
MKWTDEQRNKAINHAMDLAAGVDNFRQVLILTMTHEGAMNVVQLRTDDATQMESIGMFRLMAADVEQRMIACWKDNDSPMREDDDE